MKSAIAAPAAPRAGAGARINARLDAQASAQLQYLTATTGMGVSEVVRASLAHYYQAQRARQTHSLSHLAPLVGRYRSGRTDNSMRVKQVVAEYLDEKSQAADLPAGKAKPRRTQGAQ